MLRVVISASKPRKRTFPRLVRMEPYPDVLGNTLEVIRLSVILLKVIDTQNDAVLEQA